MPVPLFGTLMVVPLMVKRPEPAIVVPAVEIASVPPVRVRSPLNVDVPLDERVMPAEEEMLAV